MSDPQKYSLAVDLDGTLLRSDMLYENFWAAFRENWRTPFFCFKALLRSRAHLKDHLAQAVQLDVTRLPYDPEVIGFVKDWRAAGGHTALVTATHQVIADAIADHLGIFDAAHGSDAQRNLKGRKKAAFLQAHFDQGGFAYMGDSHADLTVWPHARKAITVNATASIRQKAEAVSTDIDHMTTQAGATRPYSEVLRPRYWIRNALVFLPLLISGQGSLSALLWGVFAFLCLTLVDCAVFVMHDLLRLDKDRTQSAGKAFASGRLSIVWGTFFAAGATLLAALFSFGGGGLFFCVMLAYFLLNLAFCLVPDRARPHHILAGALFCPIRLVAGGIITSSAVAPWLLGLCALGGAGYALVRSIKTRPA